MEYEISDAQWAVIAAVNVNITTGTIGVPTKTYELTVEETEEDIGREEEIDINVEVKNE